MAIRTPQGGIQACYFPPTGQAGAYTVANSDIFIYPAGASRVSSGSWSLDAFGNAYHSGSYPSLVQSLDDTFPAKTTSTRLYRLWFYQLNAAPPSNDVGARITFNYQDVNNYWGAALGWDSGGSRWYLNLFSVIAGVVTNRSVTYMDSNADYPVAGMISAYDSGDGVVLSAHASELDASGFGTNGATTGAYTVGSRSFKSETNFAMGTNGTPGTNFRIKGFMIIDV